MAIASMEIGLPGLNSSQTAWPPSGLKAIWQSLSLGPLPVVSVSRKMNMLDCEASLGLSVTFMENFREVTLLADQARHRLSEGHCKPIRISANYSTGYLNGFVKIE
jgi:hypothetical protein